MVNVPQNLSVPWQNKIEYHRAYYQANKAGWNSKRDNREKIIPLTPLWKEIAKQRRTRKSVNVRQRKLGQRRIAINLIEHRRNYNRHYRQRAHFHLRILIDSRIGELLRKKGGKSRTLKHYGISIADILQAIGPKPDGDYHLDHIRPLVTFDLTDPLQVKEAYAPENLRWISASENCRKSSRWAGEFWTREKLKGFDSPLEYLLCSRDE